MKLIPHSRTTVGATEASAASRVLRSGNIAQGRETAALESEMSRFLGLRSAAATSSGTAALELALRALGVGEGDEVLMPSYVCSAPWHAARRCGALPVLVDSEERSVNASMRDAARKRTRKTKALILPHLFGEPADLDGARVLGIPVVEDCAQALGGQSGGAALGTFGRVCVLSFYATKLMTTGEGGMALSNDARLIARIKDLRGYDEKRTDVARLNAKMTDVQASIGRVQLRRLPGFLRARLALARRYDQALPDLGLRPPNDAAGRIYHRYALRVPDRRLEQLLDALARRGIAARRPVFRPLHLDVSGRGAFPNAERAWRTLASLPLYPSLTERDQDRVIAALGAFAAKSSTKSSII